MRGLTGAESIVKNGQPTAVIMPIAEYEELLENLHDLGVLARRKDEPTIPLAAVTPTSLPPRGAVGSKR